MEKRSTIRYLICTALIVIAIVNAICIKYKAEGISREQARNNLNQIDYCWNNIKEHFEVSEAFKICAAKSKTSFTGDVFVLDIETLEFVYEASKDVPKGKMYFTKESIGKYFKNWKAGEEAIETMMLGKNSEEGVDSSYKFDSATEWIEWKYLPSETDAYRGKQYIVVQGTQSDEVYKRYKSYFVFNYISIFMVIFIVLIMQKQGRRKDDKSR